MNERERKKREASEAGREAASPQWDQFIQCLLKAGLVSAWVIHFSTLIRIWTSNRLDHSYQFVLLHHTSVIPPPAICNLSGMARMENGLFSSQTKERNMIIGIRCVCVAR